mgnify:CR=1 FL=1|tara:strand:+ start:244 stop:519 length:276 start_codon:yes stop_codon:yes gene_type:complete
MASDAVAEIKLSLDANQLIIGANMAKKNLRKGKAKKIYLATNCSPEIKEDITAMAKVSDIPVENLKIPNEELGIVCKKTFSISVVSVNEQD